MIEKNRKLDSVENLMQKFICISQKGLEPDVFQNNTVEFLFPPRLLTLKISHRDLIIILEFPKFSQFRNDQLTPGISHHQKIQQP